MNPRIVVLSPVTLVGMRIQTTLADHSQTPGLWQSFGPRRKEVPHKDGEDAYSVTRLLGLGRYAPNTQVERWAAVPVRHFLDLPKDMMAFDLPGGTYATFTYRGTVADFIPVLTHFHEEWLPNSEFELDDRPHFEILGPDYLGPNNPDSRERIFIPVK